jgi:hypothetical protein
MSKWPDIYFPRVPKPLATAAGHDHSFSYRHDGPGVVQCDDSRCRTELIKRGGIEMKRMTVYVAEGINSLNVPQLGGERPHLHEPSGKDRTITCDSPTCVEQFLLGIEDASIGRFGPFSKTAASRPLSVTQREERERAAQEFAEEQARVEVEVGRIRRRSLLPTLRG